MGMEISKELLSEVIEEYIDSIRVDGNEITYAFRVSSYGMTPCGYTHDEGSINIYELADKTIDWIESQGYYILNKEVNIYRLYIRANEVYSIDTKTRFDVPFMCGQWILDNKK